MLVHLHLLCGFYGAGAPKLWQHNLQSLKGLSTACDIRLQIDARRWRRGSVCTWNDHGSGRVVTVLRRRCDVQLNLWFPSKCAFRSKCAFAQPLRVQDASLCSANIRQCSCFFSRADFVGKFGLVSSCLTVADRLCVSHYLMSERLGLALMTQRR